MVKRDTTKAGCLGAGIAGALFAVIFCAGCGIFGFVWYATDGPRDAALAYFDALGAGDGEDACGRMTTSFQRQMTKRWSAETCPGAVSAMLADLSDDERRKVSRTGSSKVRMSGGDATAEMHSNPLGVVFVQLTKADGEWLVSGHQ